MCSLIFFRLLIYVDLGDIIFWLMRNYFDYLRYLQEGGSLKDEQKWLSEKGFYTEKEQVFSRHIVAIMEHKCVLEFRNK